MLSNIGALIAVVEAGSFARAAEALGLSSSGVSRAVARLEEQLGVRLLHRTTRWVTVTPEGQSFYDQVKPMLSGIEDAAATLSSDDHKVKGRLRVCIDPFFSRLLLAPRLQEFTAKHPQLEVELLAKQEFSDLTAEGVDIAIRFGPPTPSSLVARKLLDTRILTVAAPAYLAAHGRPADIAELAGHECVQFLDPATHRKFEWEFHRAGEIVPVPTHGNIMVSDVGTMLGLCISGAGICQVMALGTGDYILRGELIELFPEWNGETFPLYALYQSRRHVAPKVRAFIDFCSELARGPFENLTDAAPRVTK